MRRRFLENHAIGLSILVTVMFAASIALESASLWLLTPSKETR